jgi:hypothetical protein
VIEPFSGKSRSRMFSSRFALQAFRMSCMEYGEKSNRGSVPTLVTFVGS